MNLLIRILFVVLAPFSLYLTACAEADHENGSNTIEKVMIKESVIDNYRFKKWHDIFLCGCS